jgi:Flp pilus assembly protein TadD
LGAVQFAPTNVGMLRRVSELRMRRGDPEGALIWARRATAANLWDATNHNHEATVLLALGDMAAAEAAARKALSLAPNNAAFSRRSAYFESMAEA